MQRVPPRAWMLATLAASFILLGRDAAATEVCPIVSVGLDSTWATTYTDSYFGESITQTFATPPSQRRIKSITVWRALWEPRYGWPIFISIGNVDGSGAPVARPLLLDRARMVALNGDSTHLGACRIDFEVPFELPKPGQYFFAIQNCSGAGLVLMMAPGNLYPEGRWGATHRTDCDWIGSPKDVFGRYELTAVDAHGNEGPGVFTGYSGVTHLELLGTRPNPAPGGAPTIEFMLDGWQPTRIELLDVAGRRVDAREVGGLGPGLHAVALRGAAAGGVYFARLIQGERILTKKVVLRP